MAENRSGTDYQEIAKNLNVSTGTVFNIFQRFEVTGKVDPISPSRVDSRILGEHEFQVVGLLLENPSLYLNEIRSKLEAETWITVSSLTLCKRHGFSRKKVQQVALLRSLEIRAKFKAEIQSFDTKQFVWLDETGCDKQDHRRL